MKIQLIELRLSNFKGCRNFSARFGQKSTDIFGDNEVGKTTLFDAFLWLLFNKDSTDRKEFEIKTLDENNQPYRKLIHSVEGEFIIDGTHTVLRKEMREKWTKKRGTAVEEFTGHETAYFWNDVPMQLKDFQEKISSYINESTFKLITNTTYFNSMKWQDRRAVLMQIAGGVNEMEIVAAINILPEHKQMLIEAIKAGKSKENFKAYRAEVSAKRTKIKNELDLMPSRIEEAAHAVPDEVDYSEIESKLETVKADIENVEGILGNKSKAYQQHQDSVMQLMNQRQGKQSRMQQITFEIKESMQKAGNERKAAITSKSTELIGKKSEKQKLVTEYLQAETEKKTLEEKQADVRAKWTAENARELIIDPNSLCCPACKREFEAEKVEDTKANLTKNFNADKTKNLAELSQRGTKYGEDISLLNSQKENLKAKGESLAAEIKHLEEAINILTEEDQRLTATELNPEKYNSLLDENSEWCTLRNEVDALNEQIDTPYAAEDNSSMLQRKKELVEQKEILLQQLAGKGTREKQLARVEELKAQQTTMANEVAKYEGIEFSIAAFVKACMTEVEARINSRFKLVKFKMFSEQINGGEVEDCVTLINGVPYPDVNTAGKIQAGLDIINTLAAHYDIKAPVWVDNRESVVLLPETDLQLINLVVSEADKKLRVVANGEMEMA